MDTHMQEQASPQLTPSEDDIMKGLGDWLTQTILPPSWTVRQNQQSGGGTDDTPFILMQVITRRRYATNSRTHNPDGSVTIVNHEKLGIQIMTSGAEGSDVISLISTMWRDTDTVEWFRQNVPGMAPLQTSRPRQHGITTSGKQRAGRWSVDLIADVQASITRPEQSAIHLGMQSITQADIPHTIMDSPE